MPSGGPRPGSGRKQSYCYFIAGKKYTTADEAAEANNVTKQTIHNWCNNKKRVDCWKDLIDDRDLKKNIGFNHSGILNDIKDAAMAAKKTPLEYMLDIMNDETEEKETRIRCGYYALPYCHVKPTGKKGKKEDKKDLAKKAGSGKYGASPTPLKMVR